MILNQPILRYSKDDHAPTLFYIQSFAQLQHGQCVFQQPHKLPPHLALCFVFASNIGRRELVEFGAE